MTNIHPYALINAENLNRGPLSLVINKVGTQDMESYDLAYTLVSLTQPILSQAHPNTSIAMDIAISVLENEVERNTYIRCLQNKEAGLRTIAADVVSTIASNIAFDIALETVKKLLSEDNIKRYINVEEKREMNFDILDKIAEEDGEFNMPMKPLSISSQDIFDQSTEISDFKKCYKTMLKNAQDLLISEASEDIIETALSASLSLSQDKLKATFVKATLENAMILNMIEEMGTDIDLGILKIDEEYSPNYFRQYANSSMLTDTASNSEALAKYHALSMSFSNSHSKFSDNLNEVKVRRSNKPKDGLKKKEKEEKWRMWKKGKKSILSRMRNSKGKKNCGVTQDEVIEKIEIYSLFDEDLSCSS